MRNTPVASREPRVASLDVSSVCSIFLNDDKTKSVGIRKTESSVCTNKPATRGPRPETVRRPGAHETYSTPAGRAISTPGPMGSPRVIQPIRKMIQAICRQTAMGIRLDTRVPMAALGMYFS